MIQRCFAKRTKSESFVSIGKVFRGYQQGVFSDKV
jgi:hypothetical protein